jgi:hypothetical protein
MRASVCLARSSGETPPVEIPAAAEEVNDVEDVEGVDEVEDVEAVLDVAIVVGTFCGLDVVVGSGAAVGPEAAGVLRVGEFSPPRKGFDVGAAVGAVVHALAMTKTRAASPL